MDLFIYTSVLLLLALSLFAIRARFLSFRGQRPHDYLGLGPDFTFETYLAGSLLCEGVIFGPTGRVTSRFIAHMDGTWSDEGGELATKFVYDGGAVQERAWRISYAGCAEGQFHADADDIVGRGRGTIFGPIVQLKYRIILPEDAGGHRLDVIDWMYVLDNGTIINRSQFRKFGLLVAELFATIRKDQT